MTSHKIAILGASGYTGAELVRLVATHPGLEIVALGADRRAGSALGSVFPHLAYLDLPVLQRFEEIDFSDVEMVFCALPHGTSQEIVQALPAHVKAIDLSAGFRLRDPNIYEEWYGAPHAAVGLQETAVYGLTEWYRDEIRASRLVAGTGCNAATGNLALLPLIKDQVIDLDEIIINLATGVSGAGRAVKEGMLHAEVSEGYHAYALSGHRHLAEFEQEFARVAGRAVSPTFMPHLAPMNRGILATIYVTGDADTIHTSLEKAYADEPFMRVLPIGEAPATRHVRGSNFCHLGVVKDRRAGRAIVFSALDNLTKGSSGQALQNANLMLGIEETAGLMLAPLFP